MNPVPGFIVNDWSEFCSRRSAFFVILICVNWLMSLPWWECGYYIIFRCLQVQVYAYLVPDLIAGQEEYKPVMRGLTGCNL